MVKVLAPRVGSGLLNRVRSRRRVGDAWRTGLRRPAQPFGSTREHTSLEGFRWLETMRCISSSQRRTPAGFPARRESSVTCSYIALPHHRYTVKRSLRDFEQWAGTTAEVEVARTCADLRRGMNILHELHEQRWQSAGKAGLFASPHFRSLHSMVMSELLERGELDLRWLVANGAPVAINYSIIRGNRLFHYQGGRATDLPKRVRAPSAHHTGGHRGRPRRIRPARRGHALQASPSHGHAPAHCTARHTPLRGGGCAQGYRFRARPPRRGAQAPAHAARDGAAKHNGIQAHLSAFSARAFARIGPGSHQPKQLAHIHSRE